MARKGEELKQIKGVGPALAKRLVQAGFDTIDKIAATDIEALMKVKGVRQQTADSILEQALGLCSDAEEKEQERDVPRKAVQSKKAKVSKTAGASRKGGKDEESGEEEEGKLKEKLVRNAAILKDQMIEFAAQIKGRLGDQLKGKTAKKIEKELLTVVGCLDEIVTGTGDKIAKKASKAVKKAKKRLIEFCDGDAKLIGKGMKKIRRSLEKVIEK